MNKYTMPTGKGEQLVKGITTPAAISFEVIAHGDESWFNVHREMSPGLGGAPLTATLLDANGNTLATTTHTASNQPHLQHTGAPYKLPNASIPSLTPGSYVYQLTAPDNAQHSGVVVGRQNGGNTHA